MDIFSYSIISISFLSGSPQSSFSGIRARSVSQHVQIGKEIFLPFKAKCYSNPDGLQGFLTKSGRAELCVRTLDSAVASYPALRGAIIHSDRGSQYTSGAYRALNFNDAQEPKLCEN